MSTEPGKRSGGETGQDPAGLGDVVEWCDHCLSDTPHTVAIHIMSESDEPEKAAFSRQPYRRSQCLSCGETSQVRLNDA